MAGISTYFDPLRQACITPQTDQTFPTFISGATVASMPRWVATQNSALLSSGRLTVAMVPVYPGLVINKITFFSATTAASVPLNQWFFLASTDGNRTLLAITSDDTTTAWAANASKTLTLGTPYSVPTGVYTIYAGINVTATTAPSLVASNSNVNNVWGVTAATPQLVANSSTGQTVPGSCPNPIGALTVGAAVVYVVLS